MITSGSYDKKKSFCLSERQRRGLNIKRKFRGNVLGSKQYIIFIPAIIQKEVAFSKVSVKNQQHSNQVLRRPVAA